MLTPICRFFLRIPFKANPVHLTSILTGSPRSLARSCKMTPRGLCWQAWD
jgi:hypothetical protein